MICPYTVHRIETTQATIEYDADGKETGCSRVTTNYAKPITCKKEDCGAWQDEKCCYGKLS